LNIEEESEASSQQPRIPPKKSTRQKTIEYRRTKLKAKQE
jgi:hypothetical protein